MSDVEGIDDGYPIGMPRDAAIIERDVVRVVVLNEAGCVLLFHANFLDQPEVGLWWELPGGGIEPGETYLEAAIRELREETGLVVEAAQISGPTWRRTATFAYRDGRRLQHEVVVTARVPGTPTIDVSGQMAYELEDYPDSRWWPVAEVSASAERFYPGRLPQYIDAHLRGEPIEEPFELWS